MTIVANNDNSTKDSHPNVDYANDEHDYFIYHYIDKYINATARKVLHVLRHPQSHFRRQNIQFASMNLAVASNFVIVTAASSNHV